MDEEHKSLEENETYVLRRLPPGVRAIGTKWVFKIKLGLQGETLRYKCRIVVKGYRQVSGEHFTYTLAPTLQMASLRIFLILAMHHRWDIEQFDTKTAFLIPELNEDEQIWITPPEGIEVPAGFAWLLLKGMYGCAQASHLWHGHQQKTILSIGFLPTSADECLYTKVDEKGSLVAILFTWVDDGCVAGSPTAIEETMVALEKAYPMKRMGRPSLLIGMGIQYQLSTGRVSISQEQYTRQFLSRFGYDNMNRCLTPATCRLSKQDCPKPGSNEQKHMAKFPMKQVVGGAGWLVTGSRPDIVQTQEKEEG